jgi:hypothetical protein
MKNMSIIATEKDKINKQHFVENKRQMSSMS